MRALPSVCSGLDRVEQLAQLALGRAVAAGDRRLFGQLLRERAAAAPGLAGLLVVVDPGEDLGQVVAGVAEEALVFRGDDGARRPAVVGQPGRRAAAGARAQHGLGAQAFDGELADGRLHREGGVGQQQLRLQRQRAADAGALQLGQRRHQHGVPAGDGRVLYAKVKLEVPRREAAGPGALEQRVAVGRLGRGLEGAGQRVAVAPHGGHQPLDLDRLCAQRGHVGTARRAAHLLLAGGFVPGEMHGAPETGVQRMAVQLAARTH